MLLASAGWALQCPSPLLWIESSSGHELVLEFDLLWIVPLTTVLPSALAVLVAADLLEGRARSPFIAGFLRVCAVAWFTLVSLCLASHAAGNVLYLEEVDAAIEYSMAHPMRCGTSVRHWQGYLMAHRATTLFLLFSHRVGGVAVVAFLAAGCRGRVSPEPYRWIGQILGALLCLGLLLVPDLEVATHDLRSSRQSSEEALLDPLVAGAALTPFRVWAAFIGCAAIAAGACLRIPYLPRFVFRLVTGWRRIMIRGATSEVEREFGPRWGHELEDRRHL